MRQFLKTFILLELGMAVPMISFGATPAQSIEQSATTHPNASPSDNLTFVYLHGFGGIKKDPAFCGNMREFLKEYASLDEKTRQQLRSSTTKSEFRFLPDGKGSGWRA